jgi:hypothetical protein
LPAFSWSATWPSARQNRSRFRALSKSSFAHDSRHRGALRRELPQLGRHRRSASQSGVLRRLLKRLGNSRIAALGRKREMSSPLLRVADDLRQPCM